MDDLDKAAGLFVQRLNAGAYEAIYKDTAQEFKQNQTKETILDNLKELTTHGQLKSFQRVKLPYEPGKKRIASPVYSVLFDKTRGDLTLNFLDDSGEWKLIGFAFKMRQ